MYFVSFFSTLFKVVEFSTFSSSRQEVNFVDVSGTHACAVLNICMADTKQLTADLEGNQSPEGTVLIENTQF